MRQTPCESGVVDHSRLGRGPPALWTSARIGACFSRFTGWTYAGNRDESGTPARCPRCRPGLSSRTAGPAWGVQDLLEREPLSAAAQRPQGARGRRRQRQPLSRLRVQRPGRRPGAALRRPARVPCRRHRFVVFPWRSFEAYPIVTQVVGGTCVQVPLRADETHDVEAMAAAVTPRTRAVLVCNPNNPTSTSVPGADLSRLLDAVPSDLHGSTNFRRRVGATTTAAALRAAIEEAGDG